MKAYEKLFKNAYNSGLIMAEYDIDLDEFEYFDTYEAACEHIAGIAEEVGVVFFKDGDLFGSALVCSCDLDDDETVIYCSPNMGEFI